MSVDFQRSRDLFVSQSVCDRRDVDVVRKQDACVRMAEVVEPDLGQLIFLPLTLTVVHVDDVTQLFGGDVQCDPGARVELGLDEDGTLFKPGQAFTAPCRSEGLGVLISFFLPALQFREAFVRERQGSDYQPSFSAISGSDRWRSSS